MFKPLAAGFNRCSENKKNSAYRQIDSPTNPEPPTYSEKDKPEEKATTQAMQQHESYVQVCPHERLSFERFQRIQDLMRDEKDRRLDALSAMPKNHENMQCVQSFESRMNDPSMYDFYQICRPKVATSETTCVQGQAAYKPTCTRDGLDLLSFWKIDFNHHQYNGEAFTGIQDLLEFFHVWLCPHRRLHDADIVSKLVSMMLPRQRDPDPVRRLEKNIELRQCQSCKSMFEFRMETKSCIVVGVKRIIKAKTAEDASWLAHCSRTEDKK
ncbi:hypothetical protein JMJ35_008236 [Cladonia borealis]|uniref:Uncharacterized protein n=1 Tax=Cladonia borealis TaxID=184061 RepID=A0AA39QVI6_9LECA|nr:hypothetical protein JMJ35_008236 [Cladonia borealis]